MQHGYMYTSTLYMKQCFHAETGRNAFAFTQTYIADAITPITNWSEGNSCTSFTIRKDRMARRAASPTPALMPCAISTSSTVPVIILARQAHGR